MSIAMKMKNNYILVEEIPQETVTSGGIFIPEEKYNRKAKVLCSDNDQVKEGDTVIKTIGKGTEYTLNGKKVEILHLNHILAVIEENGTKTTGT